MGRGDIVIIGAGVVGLSIAARFSGPIVQSMFLKDTIPLARKQVAGIARRSIVASIIPEDR